jgi:molecular chaperone DnaJ
MLRCSSLLSIGEAPRNQVTEIKLDVDNSYSELGLTEDATDAEIKAAWRRLAARWHPDRNRSPAALRKIQRINRALEEIRKSRRTAVAVGDEGDSGTDDDSQAESQSASDGRETRSARPERTLHHTVRVTLEDAVAGCVRDIQGEVVDPCGECDGAGLQTHVGGCQACGGAGRVRQQLWFLWTSALVECRACQGQGLAREPCGACEGTGKAPARRYRCRVQIPPGARDGDLLHVPARARGDSEGKEALSIRVELQPHEFFELEDDGTVKCELPVDGFAWIANRWIEVPTPAGLQQMRLRRGHLVYRIKGQGFPSQRSGAHADCIVTVVPLFPEEFSSKQEAQIDRLIETNSGAAGTAAGKRASAWNQTLKKWRARLPEKPRQDARG